MGGDQTDSFAHCQSRLCIRPAHHFHGIPGLYYRWMLVNDHQSTSNHSTALKSQLSQAVMKSRQIKRVAKSFTVTEKQLDKICDQMQVLQGRIGDLQIRHKRATKRQQRAICQQLALQLSVLRGAYNIFHHTASHKVTELEAMQVNTRD